jgi:molybdopterin-dependent oxidoreductase alpha subunit
MLLAAHPGMPDRDTPSASRPDRAGGLPALGSTVKHLRKERAVSRGVRALRLLNQDRGIDCPGCAWPEGADRSHFEFCENGAKAIAAEATTKRADPEFFVRHSLEELREHDDYWLEQQGRLTHPMIVRKGGTHYEPLSWDEAFRIAGDALRALDDPDQAAVYTSGRTSNEAAFMLQLFVRMYGTNNLPDCSNLCHESSGVGLTRAIGFGKGAVQLEDFEKADAIFVIGQNPGTNHPRMLTVLQAAARRGAEIVSINPLREPGLERFTHPQEAVATLTGRSTRISSHYLQPRPGSDVALLKGMMKHVLEAEREMPGRVLDHGFIGRHTEGLDDLVADLDATPWERIERETGLTEREIRPVSEVYIRSRATILCWAMGLTQHPNGVDNVIACANLLMLKGNIGRPGAGPCPVRGHSNVQGDRTVGITARPKSDFLDRLGEAFDFEPPREDGLDAVETIQAMEAGRIRFFLAMGGNFHSANPDLDRTGAAMERTDLSVFIATKLNRSHLTFGGEAMIWPCLGRTERDEREGRPQRVTVEDSMGVVHASRGRNRPASPELLSEPQIVAGLAQAALPPSAAVDWAAWADDYDRVRDAIARVIPVFEGYNERIDEPGGFLLPNPPRERVWATETTKANFIPVATPDLHLPEGQLWLFTIRSHDQYNTTVYGMDDRYRGVKGERRVVFMHPDDLAVRGLAPGDAVDVRSHWRDDRDRIARGFRALAYDIPRGSAAAYFPEANVLVPLESTAAGSNTPTSKLVAVSVHPAAEG